jgi:16S rRNA (cytosine967-C5)-methyltransferase
LTPRRPPADARALAARRAALRVLLASETLPFDPACELVLERRPLSHQDRALARTLAVGTLKLRRRLDFMLDQVLDVKHKPLPVAIQQVLRLGAFQLTELTRVPDFAAVSTAVELAKQWGHEGTSRLVNAVLRRLASHEGAWPWPESKGDPVTNLATVHSYPNWIVRMWLTELGEEEALARCKAGNRRAGLTVRMFRGRTWEPEALEWLHELHSDSKPARWFAEYRYLPDAPDVGPLFEHHGADCVVQNEAGAAAVYLLQLEPGDTVLDVCSAPGGKLTHAMQFVGERGRLLALEVHARRIKRLVGNLARLGARRALVVRADGRHLPAQGVSKILLDAPCTGLGLLHRHPELRWQKRPEDITRLAAIQTELLEAAVRALAPGGRLVYSTCSTVRAENEAQIEGVLKRHRELAVVDPRPLLPAGLPAEPQWVSILPDPPRLDGAFACALEKKNGVGP